MSDDTAPKSKLLLVDDDRPFLEDAVAVLSRDFDCVSVANPDDVLSMCDVEDPDVILLDLDFAGEPLGFELLPAIKDANPYLPVVMWTETDDVLARLRAQELGAFYFVHKAARPGDLRVVIDAALRKNRALLANRAMRAELDRAWGNLIYASDEMRQVVETAARAAESDHTVLITGDTGVGKGVVAYEIHKRSGRASQEFMVVECAGITEQLADNELFGHERGAFTGAYRREPGVCEAAHHGTLFLDEIGDMPASIQAKIRRVVEDNRIRRVGGQKEKLVDIRVIAATNRNLEEDVEAERFRRDLFYRLNLVRIHIPPLSERKADIRPLAVHFLGAFTASMPEPYELSPEAVMYLESREWQGNVRELKNVVERACIMSAGPILTAEDLSGRRGEATTVISWARQKTAKLARAEREAVLEALIAGQDKTKAAELLDVSRDFIHNVIRRRAIRDEEWKKSK
ncbi:MAG: sigma-54 dependent transcriptional regulator [Candidatus Eisenbacteria bacterium]